MVEALIVAAVLSAEPSGPHPGAAIELGLGVPFRSGSAGFQLGAEALIDFDVAEKLTLGAVLPFAAGFYTLSSNSFASSSATELDLMPGARAGYAVLEWVRAVFEVGLGPNFSIVRVDVPFLNTTQTNSYTYFAMRFALAVEVAPPSLSGLFFKVTPVTLHARIGDNTFSEYRFSVGAGFRK